MNRAEALQILGLDKAMPDLTPEIVLEAFRARVKLSHPDTATETISPKHSVQELTIAKKMVLSSLSGTDLCCRLCQGRGKVRARMGFLECVACKGTGERK